MTSAKKLAIKGAAWTLVGYGANQVLRFGNNLILTRLLVPEFFGLMAVVNTLVISLELFSDVGIGQSIIRDPHGDEPSFFHTAWTLQIVRGFLLWFVSLVMTVPAARIYSEERMLWLLPFVCLTTIFAGFSSISPFLLTRRMDLGKLTIFEFVVQLFTLSAMIGLAWQSRSLWALAAGTVVGSAFRMVGSHLLIPGLQPKFAWNREALDELLSFGKWMFLATALMFLAEQSDRLILGKLLTFSLLGVYTIAYTLANIPREIVKRLSNRVIFPTISNQGDLERPILRAKILHQRRKLLLGFALFLALLVTVGDIVISTLYDQRYNQATWMMPILCGGIWFSVLFYTTSPALLAIGKPLYSAWSNCVRFVVIGVGLPVAFYTQGILGAIIVIAVSDLPLYLVNLYGLWREQLFCVTQDMQITLFFVGLLTVMLTLRYYLGFGIPIQTLLSS